MVSHFAVENPAERHHEIWMPQRMNYIRHACIISYSLNCTCLLSSWNSHGDQGSICQGRYPESLNPLINFELMHSINFFFSEKGTEMPCGGDDFVTKSRPTLETPWIVACQAPLSIGFPRQKEGLLFLSPRELSDPRINPKSPALWWILYQLSHQGSKPLRYHSSILPKG